MLALIFFVSLLNYIDRQVIYAVFPLIKKDLMLTDSQLGFLASSFMIIYMCFAPLIAFFGDRFFRPRIIGMSAVFWSFATMLTGVSKNYGQMLMARALVGVGEAGYGSVSPSYLAEWFSPDVRAKVMSFYALAIPLGSALGYLLGGTLGEEFGWRRAFFIVALPGMLLGVAAFFLRETPVKTESAEKIPFSEYRKLLSNKTYLLICFSQAMATFAVGGLAAWMPSFFVRNYGVSVGKAGLIFGAVTVAAGILGSLTGGFLGDYLKKKTPRGYFVLAYFSFFLAVPFGLFAVLARDINTAVFLFFIAEYFVFVHSGPYHAAIIEVTGINMRSMAFALDIFIIHAFGDAVSPALVGIVSDNFGLNLAVFSCVLMIVPAALLSVAAGSRYEKDFVFRESKT